MVGINYRIGNYLSIDDEGEKMRNLYLVFIFNPKTEITEIRQALAVDEDTAKERAWSEANLTGSVDDYDLFTIELGCVRARDD